MKSNFCLSIKECRLVSDTTIDHKHTEESVAGSGSYRPQWEGTQIPHAATPDHYTESASRP